MSYLVLARKYRPSTFAEVVGQEHVTRTLGNAFATGRVHHAFLFCGPRGCGKTTLARIVGKALNCQAETPAGSEGSATEPCGVCAACTSISNGSAVDYQEMDGASNRGIDAIRDLTEAVRYQPAVLRKKVYVIDEVHMLTTEAFNALLKTLEEPPPHVTFVLATTEPHKLPNTILSRCQRYDFKLVPASRLAQHLTSIFAKERLAIEPGAVSLMVRESGGSVRDALSLCDQLISYVGATTITERHVAEVLGVADRALTRTLVRALANGDAGAALTAVEAAIERGVDEVQLARAIVRYLRDLSVLQVAPGRRGLVDATDEELAELATEAGGVERSRVTQMFERMLRCCDELGKTLQPRLVLDCALIDVATIEPLVPLGDLLERLTELEGRLAGRSARPGGGGGSKARPDAGAGSRPAPARPTIPSTSGGLKTSSSPPAPASPSSLAVPGPASPADARGPVAMSGTSPPGFAGHLSGQVPQVKDPAPERSPEPGAQEQVHPAAESSASHRAEPAGGSGGALRVVPASASSPANQAQAALAASDPRERSPEPRMPASPIAREHSGAVSGPVSMQPSGPVPTVAAVAAGSGPHNDTSARPQFSAPETLADAQRAWNDVLSELENLRKFSLLGPFQHARVMSWTADQLELGFPVDAHAMGEMAMDNADELRAILRAQDPALKNLKLVVRTLDASESKAAGARSILEADRERTSAERTKREAEAREHPITKHVLRTFGAQIKEIKTDV